MPNTIVSATTTIARASPPNSPKCLAYKESVVPSSAPRSRGRSRSSGWALTPEASHVPCPVDHPHNSGLRSLLQPVPVKTTTVEQRLARLAGAAHGVVTRAQLLHAGVTRSEIEQRLATGTLLTVHQGVYRVGHRAPSGEACYMAAVLACGDGALLAGRAAGHLLGILKGKPPPPEVVVSGKRKVRGVRTRRCSRAEATVWRGIPVTTVP